MYRSRQVYFDTLTGLQIGCVDMKVPYVSRCDSNKLSDFGSVRVNRQSAVSRKKVCILYILCVCMLCIHKGRKYIYEVFFFLKTLSKHSFI